METRLEHKKILRSSDGVLQCKYISRPLGPRTAGVRPTLLATWCHSGGRAASAAGHPPPPVGNCWAKRGQSLNGLSRRVQVSLDFDYKRSE